MFQTGFSCSPKVHIIRSESSVYLAGITTVIIKSIEQQCSKVVVSRWQFRRGSLVIKIVNKLPCLSQNRSFYLHLTDKGRTTLVQKIEFMVFLSFSVSLYTLADKSRTANVDI